jgi:hypothetical protein
MILIKSCTTIVKKSPTKCVKSTPLLQAQGLERPSEGVSRGLAEARGEKERKELDEAKGAFGGKKSSAIVRVFNDN